MDMGAVLTFLRDYADLAIGVVLLVAATWVLPGRMKLYVLTAGLAVIAYEGYLRASNRKALKAADEEAQRLKARAGDLEARREGLEKDVAALNQQLAENKTRLAALSQETAALEQRGAAAVQDLTRASEGLSGESEKNQALLQRLGSTQAQLANLDEVQHALDEMSAAKP